MLFPWAFLTLLSRVLCGECGEIQNIKCTQMQNKCIYTHRHTLSQTEKYVCMCFCTTYENLKTKMEHKVSVLNISTA